MAEGIVIKNARIFNGKKFIRAGNLSAVKGIIREISGNDLKIPANFRVYDLKNRILSPGFIDIHTHGAGGIDSMEVLSKSRAQVLSEAFAKTGVTSFLLACFFENNNNSVLTALSFKKLGAVYSRFLGYYLEGPFINPVRRGMIPRKFLLDPGKSIKKAAAAIMKKYKMLKIMTVAPELKKSGDVLKFLKKNRVKPAFGHSCAGYEETKKAIRLGMRHATHLFNAMEGFHHREPGPFPAIAENQYVTAEIIADGAHVHPSVVFAAVKLLGPKRIILISDSTAMLGRRNGSYYLDSIGPFTVKSGAAYMKDGTLMGSCTTLLQMAKNVKKWCSLKNEDVLRMITHNPSKLLGFPGVGMIKKGFFADFNVLDDNLKLYQVFTGGRRVQLP